MYIFNHMLLVAEHSNLFCFESYTQSRRNKVFDFNFIVSKFIYIHISESTFSMIIVPSKKVFLHDDVIILPSNEYFDL